MPIDSWVWMMPSKFVENVVDFQNFHGEVGLLREGVLWKAVVVVVLHLHVVVVVLQMVH